MSLKMRVFRKYPKSGRTANKVIRLPTKTKKAVTKIVKKQIDRNTEYKQYAASDALQPVYDGTGGVLIHLTGISQGLQDNQRVGDEITIKYLHVRMNFWNNLLANSNPYVNFRVFIFQYKNSDMAPTMSNMLLNSNANGGTTFGTFSPRNIDYLNTYHVVYDKVVTTVAGQPNAANYGATPSLQKFIRFSVPMRMVKRKIQYQATTTSCTNGLWLFVTTDLPTIAVNPQFSIDWNVVFTDS